MNYRILVNLLYDIYISPTSSHVFCQQSLCTFARGSIGSLAAKVTVVFMWGELIWFFWCIFWWKQKLYLHSWKWYLFKCFELFVSIVFLRLLVIQLRCLRDLFWRFWLGSNLMAGSCLLGYSMGFSIFGRFFFFRVHKERQKNTTEFFGLAFYNHSFTYSPCFPIKSPNFGRSFPIFSRLFSSGKKFLVHLALKARPRLSRSCVRLLPADGTSPGCFFHLSVEASKIQMFRILTVGTPQSPDIFMNLFHHRKSRMATMWLYLWCIFFHPICFLAWCKAHAVQVEIRGQ